MMWPTVPLEKIAPAQTPNIRFSSDESVWHLTLDQVESHTGNIVNKKITPASTAGTSTNVFDDGNVLYSKLRPYLNKVICPTEPGIATTELVPLRPRKDLLDRHYLAYYLRSKHFLGFANVAVAGVKMPRIIMAKFWKHQVPLPPLSEQHRIVEILDQADALRKKRAEADAKASRILPALFYKMFGDPTTNPKGWPVAAIGEMCDVVSGATPRTNNPDFWGGAIKWATPKDLSGNPSFVINETERTITDAGYASCSTSMLPAGAILLSSRAPIGLSAIAGVPMCTNQGFKNLIIRHSLDPWYLLAWLRLRAEYLNSLGRGATFKEVSKSIVESIRVPVPPLKMQQVFATELQTIHKGGFLRRIAAERINDLFSNLLHRAFTGDLTAKWREAHMEELLAEMAAQAKALESPPTDDSAPEAWSKRGRRRKAVK
jgi:type I restriction enzyme S subunit